MTQEELQMMTSDEVLIKWRVAGSNLERLQQEKDSLSNQLNQLEKDLTDWDGAKTLLELLKNYKLEKRKDFILKVINQAMRDVFQENYRIDILPKDMKGKSAASTQKYDIVFLHNDIEIAKNDELLSSNGGGVLSIASLFFKILIGYLYSKNKFYIFDESLSQVSPQYRERLSLFLKEFCRTYGFTLVVVSQTEELEKHADIVYEVDASVDRNRVPLLKIANVQGEEPKEDFFYSRIKNFQSIKNLDFAYKGFTIIRGPNNSGKSASLRAIDAILFNNFKKDLYPRKNPNGGRLQTEIFFGYQGKKGESPKEIGLTFKRNKVMFTIEGEEYFGKSLAADKLKEAVEDIGFRYIDTKKMYKNFKGPLKEQTERIAFTSQHDGLFLIGAKTSDSEKIFSFLFNTENIALAIQESKESMQEFSKLHREIQESLIEVDTNLRKIALEIDYFLKIYYMLLVREFHNIEEKQYLLARSVETTKEMLVKVEQFVYLVESANWLQYSGDVLIENANKIEHNSRNQDLVQELLKKVQYYDDCTKVIDLANAKLRYSNELNSLNDIIPKIEALVLVDRWVSIDSQLQTLQTSTTGINALISDLDEEYHLQTCPHCSGLGVSVI